MARIVGLLKVSLSVIETKFALVRVAVKAKILMRGGMILHKFPIAENRHEIRYPKYEHNALHRPPLLPDCLCKVDEEALSDISSISFQG